MAQGEGAGTDVEDRWRRAILKRGDGAASEKTPSKEARRTMPISAHPGRQVRHHQLVSRLLRRHPAQKRDAAGADDAEHVTVWRGLSHVARELTAGPVASDEVGQIIEQHGARIGRLGDGVNVDNR